MQFLIQNINKTRFHHKICQAVKQGRIYQRLGKTLVRHFIRKQLANIILCFPHHIVQLHQYLKSLIHHSLPILYSLVFSLSPQKTRGVTAITIISMYIGKSRVYGWIKGAAVCCAHAVFERGSRQPLLYTHVDGNFQLASNRRRNHHTSLRLFYRTGSRPSHIWSRSSFSSENSMSTILNDSSW